MKINILLLTIALAIFPFTANAQQSNTFYGIQAGTNYARYTPRFPNPSTKDISFAGKIGLYIGGFFNFRISEQIRMQPSLLFASQRSKLKSENVIVRENSSDPGTIYNFEFNIIESTLVLPVVAQNHLSERFYIEAGPQAGYIFSSKVKSVGDTLPNTENDGSENVSNNDKLDLGLLVGIGYKLNGHFGLNSRYYFGIIERNDVL